MSLLGPHIMGQHAQIARLARSRPRVAKAIMPIDASWMREAKAASPRTFWIGRWYVEQQPLNDPERDAERFVSQLVRVAEPFRGVFDALEGYNEVVIDTDEQAARYAAFERRRVQLLAAEGWKPVVGNFSTGHPELARWAAFLPGLEGAYALGLHEYAAPQMQFEATWRCLRYRRVWEILPLHLRLPVVITECGIDDNAGGGWRRYADPDAYLSQLAWYDAEMRADVARGIPIIGATVFTEGRIAEDRWESFDTEGEMADRLADYIANNPTGYWEDVTMTSYDDDGLLAMLRAEFGAQFDDIRDALPCTIPAPKRALDAIRYIVIHHSGAGTTEQTWSRTIAGHHVRDKGWGRVAYHFLVHGGGSNKARYSASIDEHGYGVQGHNPDALDICLVGDYNDSPPSALMVDMTRRLCAVLRRFLGRDVPIVGHRALNETECPGNSAYSAGGWMQQVSPPDPLAELQRRLAEVTAERDAALAKIAAAKAALG